MSNSPITDKHENSCGDYEKAHRFAARTVNLARAFEIELGSMKVQRDELLSALTKLLKSCGGTCLCGRNESCSVCSRSSAQRIAESEAKELIARMVKS